MENKVIVEKIVEYLMHHASNILKSKSVDLAAVIQGPRDIVNANHSNITFISMKYKDTALDLLKKTKAAIVIMDEPIYESLVQNKGFENVKNIIVSAKDAKQLLINCLNEFFKENNQHSIHPTAIIHPTARLEKNVHVGPYTVIEKNVAIGGNTFIDSQVLIKAETIIGNNVIIKSNAVIGNSGFGFVKSESGENLAFPHYGRVIIEDHVQIGSNTCIDRGSLSDTIIKRNVKIDNLVHIAHNVEIGENSLVIACSLIGGSSKIGKNCWVAPSVSIRNKISIGDHCLIGMGSVVTKNFEDNTEIAGVPAMKLDELKKILKNQKKNL